MSKFLVLFFVASFFTPSALLAQYPAVDSLLRLAKTEKNVRKKVDLLNAASKNLFGTDKISAAKQQIESAIHLSDEAKYEKGKATALLVKGVIADREGDYEQSIECFSVAKEIYARMKDHKNELNAINNLGIIYEHLGEYDQAINCHTKALAVRIDIKDTIGMASSFNNLGVIYMMKGETLNALWHYEKAMRLDSIQGRRRDVLQALVNISEIHRMLANFEEAIRLATQAATLADQMKDSSFFSQIKTTLGLASKDGGKFKQAIVYLEEALGYARLSSDIKQIANCFLNLGSAYDSNQNHHKALAVYDSCLNIYQKEGNRNELARTYINIGVIQHEKLREWAAAEHNFAEALKIGREIKSVKLEALAFLNLGQLAFDQKQYAQSNALYEKAVLLATKAGHTPSTPGQTHPTTTDNL